MSVVFINLFEVPANREKTFRTMWQQVNNYMGTQPGYQGHRLHRAIAGDARYRYANVAVWESPEAWRAAHDEGFQKLVAQPGWRDFPATPALYEVVHAGDQTASAFA